MLTLEDLYEVNWQDYDFEKCETRIDKGGPFNKFDVAAAIFHTRGNFGRMAVLLGRPRGRVRSYVMGDGMLRQVFDDVRESVIDEVEAQHFDDALDGNGSARQFILSTVGKGRGYSTRQEVESNDVTDPAIKALSFSDLSEEERSTIRSMIERKQRQAEEEGRLIGRR